MKTLTKTVVEETRDVCSLCAGRGEEMAVGVNGMIKCRHCGGSGQILKRTTTRVEHTNLDELVEAVAARLSDRTDQHKWRKEKPDERKRA